MSDFKKSLDELTKHFSRSADDVISRAEVVQPGTDPDWTTYMTSLGLTPVPPDEKMNVLVTTNQGQFQGALPSEVRDILNHHKKNILVEVRKQKSNLDDSIASDPQTTFDFDDFKTSLESLIKEKIQHYVNKSKPSFSTQGIFANAMMTSLNTGTASAQVNTKTCDCCGAARPNNSDLRTCQFCGNEFFGSSERS